MFVYLEHISTYTEETFDSFSIVIQNFLLLHFLKINTTLLTSLICVFWESFVNYKMMDVKRIKSPVSANK